MEELEEYREAKLYDKYVAILNNLEVVMHNNNLKIASFILITFKLLGLN